MGWTFWRTTEGQWIDGLLSVMVEYLRRNTIYQGVLLQSVYGQLPPRSWSTIGCQYSPQSLSSAAIRIHHQLPPRSRSTTTARCQHNKGSAIIVTTSQHDTESAILDPPLRSLIRDPQVVLHDAAIAVALDLRTVGQRNSGEEVKSVTCID